VTFPRLSSAPVRSWARWQTGRDTTWCASPALACAHPPSPFSSLLGPQFQYRTFFDLEITHEEGQGLFTTRNKQGARRRNRRCFAHAQPRADAKFDFVMPHEGRFTSCVHNRGRHHTEVSWHSVVGLREKHDKLTVDSLTPLRGDVSKLLAQLRLLAEEQAYLEARDEAHKATSESTERRTMVLAATEAAVLLAVSITQVVTIKRLFRERSGSGRIRGVLGV